MPNKIRNGLSFPTGFIMVSALGCLFHFLYQLSGNNPVVGAFTSVNESTWEHMKLLFFPMIIYVFVQWLLIGRKKSGFLPAAAKGILTGLFFIPVSFYSYTGMTGRNFFIADILIFFISVWLSIRISEKQLRKNPEAGPALNISAVIILLCLAAMFIGFTFFPPDSPMFLNVK